MNTKLLSELAKGTWSGATAYTIGDIVDLDGSSYIAIANGTNHTPPNASYWALLAKKGDTGVSDTPGDTGTSGSQGATGIKGDTGTKGDTGSGLQGSTGSQGVKGDTGTKGDTGAGITGATGTGGSKGDTGNNGDTGTQGDTGTPGGSLNWLGDWITSHSYNIDDAVQNGNPSSSYSCIQAHTSGSDDDEPGVGANWEDYWQLIAEAGDQGSTGSSGPKGDTGDAGAKGDTGTLGAKGDTGVTGATGTAGNTGVGNTGVQGATGVKGDTGSGNTGVQGATGSTGPKGDTGTQGDSGTQYPFEGEWETATDYDVNDCVEYNGSGYVCIQANTSGSTTEPGVGVDWEDYWSLLVERGLQGDTGANSTVPGATGVQGATGVGNTGVAGATGTAGAKGDTGNQGNTGTAGVKGDTGTSGSGGAKGDTGTAGNTGVQGDTGTDGSGVPVGVHITFNDTESDPPGTGQVRVNDASDFTNVDSMWFSDTDADGNDITDWLAQINNSNASVKAIIHLQDESDPTNYAVFHITGTTETGTFNGINVDYAGGVTTFTNGTELRCILISSGNNGAQGDQGDTGTAGAKGDTGTAGSAGAKGDTGSAGSQGNTGVQGATGVGNTGVTGATGVQGATGVKPSGQLFLSAAGMWPSISSGMAANTLIETATNFQDVYLLDASDSNSKLFASCVIAMPTDWDGGTITATFYWMSNSTSTNSVVWGLKGRSYGDAETLDQAFGTAGEVTDANHSTANQVQVSAATGAITLAGTPAAGELVVMEVYRDSANASDTLAATARLLGVMINYTRV